MRWRTHKQLRHKILREEGIKLKRNRASNDFDYSERTKQVNFNDDESERKKKKKMHNGVR